MNIKVMKKCCEKMLKTPSKKIFSKSCTSRFSFQCYFWILYVSTNIDLLELREKADLFVMYPFYSYSTKKVELVTCQTFSKKLRCDISRYIFQEMQ